MGGQAGIGNKVTGRCDYNSAKQCDGLCNNCPRSIEPSGEVRYVPSKDIFGCRGDYEGAILSRQESYY